MLQGTLMERAGGGGLSMRGFGRGASGLGGATGGPAMADPWGGAAAPESETSEVAAPIIRAVSPSGPPGRPNETIEAPTRARSTMGAVAVSPRGWIFCATDAD